MNDSSPAGRNPAVERLDASACWMYLQTAELGRLAVDNADGAPDIFPVNYVAHEGALYIRTARDAKLLHIAQHPMVAFEVDGADDEDHYWSVVIRGKAERVTRDEEIRDSGVRHLASWSPTAKFFVMKVVANTVTGRRFPQHMSRTDPVRAFEGDATRPTPPESSPQPRAERPEPIPHFTPRTGPQDTLPAPRSDG
ncbi:pyridoxamine 5'-phosphate oxidase family protein [Microbacterium trichothecenolyticum]|uniref:Pyridoxamine 5'-phosphate oxidase family protein n=1 Tax=Microbacterium ureisolvens TaxID=2781186 RepID=A0ABS7HXA4_9MICO|nr:MULTISPECIES: pyridoxamine 5'-phosphate oxidase family protein [Microbacterium]MBW9109668.1 pyridoxamine 5'-phosphate oxidase family protein [Microbacterium ureisolvens]MBW9120286.1 pyridoxamine 5'-phosphate oxidase family protein [Microbacterium trichothecenolyticum]